MIRAALISLTSLLLLGAAHARSDGGDKPKWDVNKPPGELKRVQFEVTEGTWMNLDVSPDGRHIVFDLLGDLYELPISGGKARRLTQGLAFDVQPRYSPDGRQIAYTSDRAGGNNLWRMNRDGSKPQQVTHESFRLFNNPAWTPDGDYLIGRKHFTSERSLGAGELWLFHVGGGDGLQLTKRKNDQQDQGEPALSPDGRYVYFSEDVSRGPSFQYNKNVHGLVYAIRRLDRQSGEITDLITSPGGAVRPQPSPDGRQLAFVKRVREKTTLQLLDLESGAVRVLWDGLSHDQQEGWAIFGPYPNYDWLPDSSAIVIWAQGKFWRVDVGTGKPAEIPFQAAIDQQVVSPLRSAQQIDEGQFTAKMIRDVATSPDGRTLIFHAVGKLWRKDLPKGQPQRLTANADSYEYQPSFSADGGKLLYTRWSDSALGAIVERDLDTGSESVLTVEPGFYYGPQYSLDGARIVYARSTGGGLTSSLWSKDRGIYWIPAAGGLPTRVAEEGQAPQFSADGSRIYFFTGEGLSKKLMSAGLHGEEPREIFNLKYVDFMALSPDRRYVAFTELYNAYVAPMPETGSSIELSKDSKALPVTRLSADAGSYLHWSGSGDQQTLHWMLGEQYISRSLSEAFDFLPGSPKERPKPEQAPALSIGLTQPVYTTSGLTAFVGGRVITMRDAENSEEVIEDGVVLVDGDRIKAVGARSEVAVPDGARVIDVSGKTLMPGIVDAHAHAAHFGGGVVPQQNWAYYANLAFGITTLHDPSATSEFVYSQAELVKAGAMVGPRVFSTGTILYGADGDIKVVIDSLDDARAHLRRMKALGAFSVKSYNQPRRDQRQQINSAARELGMLVVEEGGSTFFHNLTMVLDGVTGVEHNLPIAPLYGDVIGLMSRTDVRNTPTLVVSYGGLSGEYWWYARDNVWEEPRLNRYFPADTLGARAIRRETAPDWDYYHVEVAKAAKTLRDAGVKIQVGGHGQMQGLSPHWEIWSLHQGGFSNFEALRAATIDGADYIGLGRQLGSLEVGKQADLVVLDGNPLVDIRDSDNTAMVMVDGRLFDLASDMAEVGGKNAPAPEFFWQRQQDGRSFGIEYGPTGACHCPKSGLHVH
ncbi:MAG: amidohydrolase family protein [Lysobacterales bacterium]|nr:PD40 domain-containing protein [Xanthomonadales bacterium]